MPRPPSLVARDAALLRLRKKYRTEYDRIYDEERLARGLEPLAGRRRARIADLEKQLARLRSDL